MNVSSISITMTTQGASSASPFAQFKASVQSLKDALNSGNLADAKTAFAALEQSSPDKANSGTSVSIFASVGKALDAGDIGAALDALQKALEALATKAKKSEDTAPDLLSQLLDALKEVLDKLDSNSATGQAQDPSAAIQSLAQKLGLSSSGTYSSAGTTSISIGLSIKA